jgi:hypothetical protein
MACLCRALHWIGVASANSLQLQLLAGARELLAEHVRALPQRDDLCGAFCGALALRAAHIESFDGQPIDQDTVALAAGSVVAAEPQPGNLPSGERGRRDYRLQLPMIEDADVSGTTAAGLVRAVERLSGDALVAIPYEGPWTVDALHGTFDLLAAFTRPVSVVANIATRHLWGGGATLAEMLAYLLEGTQDGPPPDWDVGHFVCIIGRVTGPGGHLYGVADTYRSLGNAGVHVQPVERLARALQRPGMAAGGLLVIAAAGDAATLRPAAAALGLSEGAWDNGTRPAQSLA